MEVLLADLIVVVHLGYVLFVILGLVLTLLGWVLGWRWIRRPLFRVAHLTAIGVVVAEALGGVTCPLTVWERELRAAAGQDPSEMAFVPRLASDVVFIEGVPQEAMTPWYVGFFALVVLTLVCIPPRRRWREGDESQSGG